MIRSPPASSLARGAVPSPNSAMRPFAKAIQSRSMTRSASTIRALPMAVSDLVAVISRHLPSCSSGKRGHVDDPVGDQMPDLIVMHDGDQGHAPAFLLIDQ